MSTVTIKFENEQQAECFMDWLNNSGEQDYFTAADILGEEDGQEFVSDFHYDYPNRIITGQNQ